MNQKRSFHDEEYKRYASLYSLPLSIRCPSPPHAYLLLPMIIIHVNQSCLVFLTARNPYRLRRRYKKKSARRERPLLCRREATRLFVPFRRLDEFLRILRVPVLRPRAERLKVAACMRRFEGRHDPVPVSRPHDRNESHVSCAHDALAQAVDTVIWQKLLAFSMLQKSSARAAVKNSPKWARRVGLSISG